MVRGTLQQNGYDVVSGDPYLKVKDDGTYANSCNYTSENVFRASISLMVVINRQTISTVEQSRISEDVINIMRTNDLSFEDHCGLMRILQVSLSDTFVKNFTSLTEGNEYHRRRLNDNYLIQTTEERNDTNFSVQGLLSFVLTLVSLFGLLFTFMTFMFFKQLRNLHGKITMNLVCNLFIAQSLFLLTSESDFRTIHSLCTSIAVLSHYFWLATFSWLVVSSYNMYLTFNSIGAGSLGYFVENERNTLVKYMCFAYGVPLAVVSLTLVLHFIDSSPFVIGYGEGICLLTRPSASAFFFALPVGFALILNIMFFIRILISLKKSTSNVLKESRHDGSCQLFVVCVKLTVTMGLCWIFGFIAAVTHSEVLWYFFIIFNCLQGLGIMIANVSASRVRRLYAMACFKHGEAGGSSHLSSIKNQLTTKNVRDGNTVNPNTADVGLA